MLRPIRQLADGLYKISYRGFSPITAKILCKSL